MVSSLTTWNGVLPVFADAEVEKRRSTDPSDSGCSMKKLRHGVSEYAVPSMLEVRNKSRGTPSTRFGLMTLMDTVEVDGGTLANPACEGIEHQVVFSIRSV